MTTKHTPTPWRFIANSMKKEYIGRLQGIDFFSPCEILNDGAENAELAQANAAFIVLAVNAHDVLVEACKAIFTDCEPRFYQNGYRANVNSAMDNIHAALKLATGE